MHNMGYGWFKRTPNTVSWDGIVKYGHIIPLLVQLLDLIIAIIELLDRFVTTL